MSQGNKKVTARNISAANNKISFYTLWTLYYMDIVNRIIYITVFTEVK